MILAGERSDAVVTRKRNGKNSHQRNLTLTRLSKRKQVAVAYENMVWKVNSWLRTSQKQAELVERRERDKWLGWEFLLFAPWSGYSSRTPRGSRVLVRLPLLWMRSGYSTLIITHFWIQEGPELTCLHPHHQLGWSDSLVAYPTGQKATYNQVSRDFSVISHLARRWPSWFDFCCPKRSRIMRLNAS